MLHTIQNNHQNLDFAELDYYGFDHKIISDDGAAKELLSVFKTVKKINFRPQQILFHEGATADTLYIISKGLVKLVSNLAHGRTRIVRLHSPDNIIGLCGLIDANYDHTAIAINDVEVMKVPISLLKQVIHDNPDLSLYVNEQWYAYLRAADSWIIQFSTGSIRARVARLITFLSYLENEPNPEYVQLLTGEEMAAILGVTPESVSRVIADFKRQKVLQPIYGHSIELYKRDPSMLESFAQD